MANLKVVTALLKTIWLYGLMGGLYICVNAWVHPNTLPLMVTHLTPWLREDTFGVICFIASALAFFLLQTLKKSTKLFD
jgi:hypothetical protein